jgi:hypothetical protein
MQKITERIYAETQSSEAGNEGTTVPEDDTVQFEEVK